MEYEKFKKDEIVFELGSIGAKFFIILKGSIGILVEIPRQVEEILPTGEKIIKNEFILTEVKILGNGSSFGELALLEKKPRAATIICKEDTHFAVLQSKYFDKILSKFFTFFFLF